VFNVPFQHKYMAISGTKGQGWKAIRIQYRKASDILTSTLAAFLFSSHPKRERDREVKKVKINANIRLQPDSPLWTFTGFEIWHVVTNEKSVHKMDLHCWSTTRNFGKIAHNVFGGYGLPRPDSPLINTHTTTHTHFILTTR